jgi:two-component system chemotaxis response regulator CheB
METGPNRNLVVIGGSAGALEALKTIASELPADLPAAVVVALHLGANSPSLLSTILGRSSGMPAVVPRDGDPVKPGYIYVARPDHHLEVSREGFRHGHGPKVNGMRPAVDVLFQSAAAAYGAHVVAVILSGGLDDGSAGLASVKFRGGVTIVQDPDDAIVASMPANAIKRALPDTVAPSSEIGALIVEAVSQPAHAADRKTKGGASAMSGPVGSDDLDGQVTGMTCPECHGSIWMRGGPDEVTFSCRVGHTFSPDSFFEIQAENVENALWAAVRSLEEQSSLAEMMAARAKRMMDEAERDRLEGRRAVAAANAEVIRRLLVERD